MFSIFQETPFNTVDLEFVYFFFPYIITATIPTILAVGWKNVNPNRVLTDEQFWLSTCYVQVMFFFFCPLVKVVLVMVMVMVRLLLVMMMMVRLLLVMAAVDVVSGGCCCLRGCTRLTSGPLRAVQPLCTSVDSSPDVHSLPGGLPCLARPAYMLSDAFPVCAFCAPFCFTFQIWAFALGVYNRITCANPDNAWNLVCPVWPLGMLFCLLIISAVNTTIYWAFYL